jgi:secondary thiamine-phosphate synthase enzyme
MHQASGQLRIIATRPGMHLITTEVADWLARQRIQTGLLTLFCQHTSASLLIQESAAPGARRDLERYFQRVAPESDAYEHADEGPDDMPAHLRSALTQTHLAVPVVAGAMALGTWQGIYLFEHRRGTPERTIALHLLGH